VKYNAGQKLAILIKWDKARLIGVKTGIRPMKCDRLLLRVLRAHGTPISSSTLYRWRGLFADRGFAGLADFRKGRRIDRSDDPFMCEAVRLRSASKPMPLTMRECYRLSLLAAERNGWKTHSFKTMQRHLARCGFGWRAGHSGRVPNAVRSAFKGR